MYQIFVVEDELLIRQNIRKVIESMPGPFALCGEASDGEMALSGLYGIQQLGDGILPYLSSGHWYEGFRSYLESLPYYLDAYASGAPVDGYADESGDYYHGTQEEVIYYHEEKEPSFFMSLLIGMAVGGISLLVMRATMNNKRSQRSASVYMKEGSWNLHGFRDLYLYSNVTKTRKQQNTSGGGSSVHRSSGGISHGGRGGRF